MRIALDFDKTYTAHPSFWNAVLLLAKTFGVDIRIVTARSPVLDRTAPLIDVETKATVIYCNGIAKEYHCTYWTGGWYPDIWIDDKPVNIGSNSPTSPADLAAWRMERGEGPSFPLGDGLHPIFSVVSGLSGLSVSPNHMIVGVPGGGLEVVEKDAAFYPNTEPHAQPLAVSIDGDVDPEVSRMLDEGGPAHDRE